MSNNRQYLKKKSILLISNYKKGTGGISGQVEILLQKLKGEGYGVDIFNTNTSPIAKLVLFRKLRKKGQTYEVFHIHCCSNWGFIPAVVGAIVGRKLKKTVVLTYHGGGAERFFRKHTEIVRFILTRTDVNIVLSGFLGCVFDKYRFPYVIVPNAIELDFSRFRKRDVLNPNFICVRSLESLYNISCIIKAFAEVKKQYPNATLTLVGDGSLRCELEQFVDDLKVSDVTFVGRVENKDIYCYLNQADIMLSAPHIDNMPVSLLEGFNAGLLVISSNVGGVPYMIEDGKTGLLFEDDNDVELANRMISALEKQPLFIIQNAYDSLVNYTWDSVKDKLEEIYNKE